MRFLPLLCLAACGPAPEPVCLGPVEGPADGVALAVERVVSLMPRHGIRSEESACRLMAGVSVQVTPALEAKGSYRMDRTILISHNLVGFAHETLHAHEHEAGTIDWDNPHRGWSESRAYRDFVQEYVSEYLAR